MFVVTSLGNHKVVKGDGSSIFTGRVLVEGCQYSATTKDGGGIEILGHSDECPKLECRIRRDAAKREARRLAFVGPLYEEELAPVGRGELLSQYEDDD